MLFQTFISSQHSLIFKCNQIIKAAQSQKMSITQQQKQHNICAKIIDGLYIGTQQMLHDQQYMLANYVTHVVKVRQYSNVNQIQKQKLNNLQKTLPVQQLNLHMLILDFKQILQSQKCPKNSNLQKTFKFLEQARQNGECCLIIDQNQQNPGAAFTLIVVYFIQRFSWSLLKTLQFMNYKLKGIFVNQNHYNYLTNFQLNCLQEGDKNFSYNWETYQNEQDLVLRNTYLNGSGINLITPQLKNQKFCVLIQNNKSQKSKISLKDKINPLNKIIDQNKQLSCNKIRKQTLKQSGNQTNLSKRNQRVEFNLSFNCIKQFKKQQQADIFNFKFNKSQSQINLSVQKLVTKSKYNKLQQKINQPKANQILNQTGNNKKLKKHESFYSFSKYQVQNNQNQSIQQQNHHYQNQIVQIAKKISVQKKQNTEQSIKQIKDTQNLITQNSQSCFDMIKNKMILETMHTTNQDDRYSSSSLSPCKQKKYSESFKQNIKTMQKMVSFQLKTNPLRKTLKETQLNSLIKLERYPKSKHLNQNKMCNFIQKDYQQGQIFQNKKSRQFKWR